MDIAYCYCSVVPVSEKNRRRAETLSSKEGRCFFRSRPGAQTRRNRILAEGGDSDTVQQRGSAGSLHTSRSRSKGKDKEQEKHGEGGGSTAKAVGMLGQSFNAAGIASFFYILGREPSLAVPHVETPDLRNIKWDELKRAGFEGCVFDKDNTLTEPYAMEVHPFASQALTECIRVFGREKVVLYSNSAGLAQFDPEGKEAERMEEALGLVVLRHREKKPGGGAEDVEAYFGCSADRLIMVGDRYLTDVAFGNRLGMMTIRPRPITLKGEPVAVRVSRWVEEKFVASCAAKGVQAPGHRLLD